MELFGQWGSRGRGGVEQGGTGSSCSCNFYTFRAVGPGSHFILQHRSEHPALLRMALINPPTHDPRKSPPPSSYSLFTLHSYLKRSSREGGGEGGERESRFHFPFGVAFENVKFLILFAQAESAQKHPGVRLLSCACCHPTPSSTPSTPSYGPAEHCSALDTGPLAGIAFNAY